MGISFVDLDHAKGNLLAQLGNQSFDSCRNATYSTWNEKLSRLAVTGVDDDELVRWDLGADLGGDFRGQKGGGGSWWAW